MGDSPVVPVTFNTGQILLGLGGGVPSLARITGRLWWRLRTWLVRTQDSDGCWRKHPTPFAAPGEKMYEAHAARGLFEAARLERSNGYAEAAMRNL